MKLRANSTTERLGVNYARCVVERAGSLFKEINLQHDYGHDATVMLVVDSEVQPREIALQIKSGASYITGHTCRIPATAAHIYFWAHHDLTTLGVVYDPSTGQAYWIDLQAASQSFRRHNWESGTTFQIRKSLWNRFDDEQFSSVLLPALLGQAPKLPLETLIGWVQSDDLDAHNLGVRAIRARHSRSLRAWQCLIDAFKSRRADMLTMQIGVAFSTILGHDDLGYSGDIPDKVRAAIVPQILAFEVLEIIKVLSLIENEGFERGSDCYYLLPILAARSDSALIWKAICEHESASDHVKEYAQGLRDWHTHDPDWFQCWRRA